MSDTTTLNRTISLPMMVLYGLGTTIGAGIYVLVGELAGISGYFAPLSFLVAALLACLTALSFAELSSRYPRAAGASMYVQQGFSSRHLSLFVGLLVIVAGLVSSSALVIGFVGYLQSIVDFDRTAIVMIVVLSIGAIAAWGIKESVMLAGFITMIEIGGLLLVASVSFNEIPSFNDTLIRLNPGANVQHWASISAGALLAFYAFIGFEDMVDVAEEVKRVRHSLPIAIMLTLLITTILYVMIMVIAVVSVPIDEFATSKAPLAYLYEFHTGQDATIISIIGMFAIINGSLIQLIMVSRVMYGLSSRKLLPGIFSTVNSKTRTPLFATMVSTIVVLLLAMVGHITTLAEITSLIMLFVFALINLALWRIKKSPARQQGITVFPRWIPLAGFLVSSGFVLRELVLRIKEYLI